jgi:hypothetical protein
MTHWQGGQEVMEGEGRYWIVGTLDDGSAFGRGYLGFYQLLGQCSG